MKKSYEERMIVKEWMVNSLLLLMETTPYDDITITQITNKAGVPRITYYRNYLRKEEILAGYSEYLTEKFASRTRSIEELNNSNYFKVLFDFCFDYIDYLSAIIKNNKLNLVLDTINKNIDKITEGGNNVYLIKYYAGAIFNVLINWLQNDAKESSKEMSEKLDSLICNTTLRHIMGLYHYSFRQLN